ncbi:MAG: hypothetical protein M3302_09635, partial [Actinomycetota bacterium]|nr:hypothetical protein [Actinomycetota bacterium]
DLPVTHAYPVARRGSGSPPLIAAYPEGLGAVVASAGPCRRWDVVHRRGQTNVTRSGTGKPHSQAGAA